MEGKAESGVNATLTELLAVHSYIERGQAVEDEDENASEDENVEDEETQCSGREEVQALETQVKKYKDGKGGNLLKHSSTR